MKQHSQSGITLVVSLIMLVVLTLLVVSAIRFGNINLKIASNAQFEAEASAASMVALEKSLVPMADSATKVDEIPTQTIAVSTGAVTYTVNVVRPNCILTKNVMASTLDWQKHPEDQACYEPMCDSGGMLKDDGAGGITKADCPSACKEQQWDVAAKVDDKWSGAKVEMVQGVSVRVGAEVQCP